MKGSIRFLWMTLGLAVFLVLPAKASEPPSGGASPDAAVVQAAPPAQAEPFDVQGVPEPRWMSGTVDCSSCANHTPNPAAQCNKQCRDMGGYYVESCEADATTCELLFCFCMYDW
jgi:hypothetical protein